MRVHSNFESTVKKKRENSACVSACSWYRLDRNISFQTVNYDLAACMKCIRINRIFSGAAHFCVRIISIATAAPSHDSDDNGGKGQNRKERSFPRLDTTIRRTYECGAVVAAVADHYYVNRITLYIVIITVVKVSAVYAFSLLEYRVPRAGPPHDGKDTASGFMRSFHFHFSIVRIPTGRKTHSE